MEEEEEQEEREEPEEPEDQEEASSQDRKRPAKDRMSHFQPKRQNVAQDHVTMRHLAQMRPCPRYHCLSSEPQLHRAAQSFAVTVSDVPSIQNLDIAEDAYDLPTITVEPATERV